ncbi:MAG: type II secretion system secretin GspD [Burkholderiaceae bacterium]
MTKPFSEPLPRPLRLAAVSLAVCAALSGGPLRAQTAVNTASGSVRPGEAVTLNFANADIEAVARTMATITGRNVIVDPRVKGTITLVTDKAVSPAAAFNQFLAAMRLQGFTVVESAGLYKVVPEADAKLQSGTVLSAPAGSADPRASGGQIVTQIFRLNYENANNLVPILRPLISPNNTINVNPGNNSLVITDYADNLQRIGRIIAASDVAGGTDVEIIPLKNAIASDLAPLVLRLVDSGTAAGAVGQPAPDSSSRTSLIAEPRSNALILRASNPARASLVRSLIAQLDKAPASSPNGNAGNIYVVYLKNADATKIAVTLRAAIASGGSNVSVGGLGATTSFNAASGTSQAGGVGTGASSSQQSQAATGILGGAGTSQPSTGGQIQADPATNSLIITAPEPQYRQLRAVIDKLDSRRAQVFVETLIAEVNTDKAAEFGVQLQGLIGRDGNRTIGAAGTNFGSGSSNIFTLATQAATGTISPAGGLNIGIGRDVGGTYVLSALARFLETNGSGNILSTPNLLTLDNEEARIVIGQNVPFITGSFTNTGGGNNGSVNPFQTVERRDVGLTVRVKPQISENGTVKMQVFLESSTVQASSINSATGLITNKRSIESNVLVEDGAIVVLGGLLQDQFSDTQEKVPVLGDVPYLGNLFKTENRSRSKTNLMVFLRPVVIRDAVASDALSSDRYEQIRGEQKTSQPDRNPALPIDAAAILPPQVPLGVAPGTLAPKNKP